jgi:septal ring factor EnvC (AmiA/AmiB activator)
MTNRYNHLKLNNQSMRKFNSLLDNSEGGMARVSRHAKSTSASSDKIRDNFDDVTRIQKKMNELQAQQNTLLERTIGFAKKIGLSPAHIKLM